MGDVLNKAASCASPKSLSTHHSHRLLLELWGQLFGNNHTEVILPRTAAHHALTIFPLPT